MTSPDPPKKVEYTRAVPLGFNWLTKALPALFVIAALFADWTAAELTGKSSDVVVPAMYALPEWSIAIPYAVSEPLPPTKVE